LVRASGFESSLTIKFDQQRLGMQVGQPDEDDLKAFLVTFRSFVSNDEPVHVNGVYNVLWREMQGDRAREELAKARSMWKAACQSGALALNVDGKQVKPEDILDFWVNGIYFHSDKRKRAALETLGPLGVPLARYKFLDHLVIGTRYVFYLRQVIIRGRSDGLLAI
jgi:hypothetical protein